MEKRLYRDERRKSIGGVCAGLAEYFGVDVSVVRVVFVLALLLKGVGFLPYIVLWAVLPKKPYGYNEFGSPVDGGFNANYNTNYNNVDYNVPPTGAPFVPPVKQPSKAPAMFGVILIVLGALFLVDRLDIMPELDFEKLWPVVLIAIGGLIIFNGQKKEPVISDFNTPKEDPYKTTAANTEGKDAGSEENPNHNPTNF
ncbi:PspC domain-containing protein [Mucilaginibacter pallidiroseus]|uniref:PspC domain-containing protein n=1 Tax=Mucilaginibacter pallidiroseus TaxID=2599295 RepID=A0A563U537_9SPHI|nr:PspC domain-containing protein [Mucilaginibacter pallidiroseus]TWR26466.1 PspC domain-containing protein [Mucilaginibacter pallidiroseus]